MTGWGAFAACASAPADQRKRIGITNANAVILKLFFRILFSDEEHLCFEPLTVRPRKCATDEGIRFVLTNAALHLADQCHRRSVRSAPLGIGNQRGRLVAKPDL